MKPTEVDLRELERERRRAREARRERAARRRKAEMRSMRIPVLTHLSLVSTARRRGISVNALVLEAIREKIGLARE